MDDDHMRAVQTHLDRGTQTASDALDSLLDESVAWLAVFCARSAKDVTRPRLRTILDVNAIFAPSRPQDAAVEVASKRRRTKRALYVEHTKAVAAQGPTTRAMLASRLTDPSSVTIDVLAKDDIKVDPSTLKVVELKAALKKRGLRVGGLKIVLVQRLQAALDLEQAATCQDPLLDQTPPLTTDFPLAIASTGIMLPEDATSPRQPNVAARSTIDVLAASQVQSMDAVPTTSRQQLERDAPSLSPIAVCTSTAASSFDLDEPLGFASENPFASPVAAQASLHSWPPRPHFGIPRDQQPAVVCAEASEPVRKSATSLVYFSCDELARSSPRPCALMRF
ncbi:hypothetical protein SPRG_05959 [Saprolegnia parasitica CBS 223.65]|uniref:SAP domain-containing protein n=1 Tax=Saprolegnia parasitica (strain CBS 223.65) TaxID=695850 RepID=A0A067CRI4_SAPPC|nr:hypothetical protein SPRG_05959 [Saprolegnia parasitica CBS 223.65]KDO29422.1 hypothetical protein SPRG_05959 [Saprolegnia parasitica CBS 223.65]|eukprot:XP_012199924.1 hypothetical protein SPRG_05959 [Saprolegnia parasitica CBS 223.65]